MDVRHLLPVFAVDVLDLAAGGRILPAGGLLGVEPERVSPAPLGPVSKGKD